MTGHHLLIGALGALVGGAIALAVGGLVAADTATTRPDSKAVPRCEPLENKPARTEHRRLRLAPAPVRKRLA